MTEPTNENHLATIHHSNDLIQLVRNCGAIGQAIIDYGVAHTGLGHSPPRHYVQLIQQGEVIEHYHRDMVVRTGAGAMMGPLQSHLYRSNQFIPIDGDDDITLGEIVTHNVYGPLRVGYGTAKDLILGLKYIDGLGRDIHVGGRTVKNVAGYDITRLMVGSLGELGCIYEITLRTSPIPKTVITVDIAVNNSAVLDNFISHQMVVDTAPSYLSLKIHRGESTVSLGYFGHSEAYQIPMKSLDSVFANVTGIHIRQVQEHTFEQDVSNRTRWRSWRRTAQALAKVIVPPANTGVVSQSLSDWASDHGAITIDALPTHGCIFVGGHLEPNTTMALDQEITRLITLYDGLRVWYAKPQATESIEPFVPVQPNWPMLTKLKHTMDPLRLFNPGRFLPPYKVTP